MTVQKKSPSIREIAAKTGVSKSAVALALNKPAEECPLAPATREKIQKAAARMGYRTNSMARTMRTGKFNTASLLIGNTHPFYLPAELVHGMEDTLEHYHYRLNLNWLTARKLAEPEYVPDVLEEWSCDGLLIHCPGVLPEKIMKLIERHKIPSVWANNKLEYDCVHPDDYGGAFDATTKLIELGHRDIAWLHFFRFDHYSETDRYEGYCAAMKAAGLTPVQMLEEPANEPLAKMKTDYRLELATTLLRKKNRPTAILCYELEIAAPLLTAAMQMGISVPDELSIVTFGRLNRNDTGRSLSMVQVNLDTVGSRAAEMLMAKIKRPSLKADPVVVPLSLSDACTMAPPKVP